MRLCDFYIADRQRIYVRSFTIPNNSFWYFHISKTFHKLYVCKERFRGIKKNILFFLSSFIPFLN